jgi:hypothetical protein
MWFIEFFLPKHYQEVEHLIVVIGIKKSHYFIKVTAEMKEDVMIWLRFLENYNGQTPFPSAVWSTNEAF